MQWLVILYIYDVYILQILKTPVLDWYSFHPVQTQETCLLWQGLQLFDCISQDMT